MRRAHEPDGLVQLMRDSEPVELEHGAEFGRVVREIACGKTNFGSGAGVKRVVYERGESLVIKHATVPTR